MSVLGLFIFCISIIMFFFCFYDINLSRNSFFFLIMFFFSNGFYNFFNNLRFILSYFLFILFTFFFLKIKNSNKYILIKNIKINLINYQKKMFKCLNFINYKINYLISNFIFPFLFFYKIFFFLSCLFFFFFFFKKNSNCLNELIIYFLLFS